MFIVVRAKRALAILGLTIFAFGGIIIACNRTLVPVFSQNTAEKQTCYVIDAGHGGEDGGAVSPDGVVESTLNLAIAQRTRGLLSFLGTSTTMTRSGQEAIYSPGAVTLREKKRSDLENRAALVNRCEHGILVSIHQNSLPSAPSVRGAQVFFNSAAGANILAEQVQQALNESVNAADHAKDAKQIAASIYLMQQIDCPGILIECGFLSNAADTENLQNSAYQTKLALAAAAGILRYENGASEYESK